ncbi:FecR family protein [Dyadobacter subterraneus]|uniref:FecR family protein n=1 Tax=Dyadobacter subterraneus TaxID=2773304 RepID=A0ABR9W6Z6_9BACT|nr:FecR family protein [Dyadobacter subterraneus]MBE9461235.1 FecR family protein [Dyadobacter subterraneus]
MDNKPEISPQLLEKYLQGLCSEHEKHIVENWYAGLETPGQYLESVPDSEKTELLENTLKNINQQIDREENETEIRKFPWSRVIGIAASVLFVLGFFYYQFAPKKSADSISAIENFEESKDLVEFRNYESRIVQHQLPDGSTVWMHKNATITYPKVFAQNNRTVQFKGEGFFNVQKNKKKPFSIITGEMVVKVLGTSFNVKAVSEGKHFEISVVTGRVEVSAPDIEAKTQQVILKPNQQALFELESKKLSFQEMAGLQKKEIYQPVSITFTDTPLRDAIRQLEKKFNVSIKLSDPGIAKCRISADFEQQPLPAIMDMLCKTLEANYIINENTITIQGEPCE